MPKLPNQQRDQEDTKQVQNQMSKQQDTDIIVQKRLQVREKLAIALMAIGGSLVLAIVWYSLIPKQKAPAVVIITPTVNQLHDQFVTVANDYVLAPASAQTQKVNALQQAASRRQVVMAKLLKSDPKKFLSLALTTDDRANLPADIQPLVEQEVDIQGKLIFEHTDSVDMKISTDQFYLESVDANKTVQRTPIYFAIKPSLAKLNAMVTLHGSILNGLVAVAGDSSSVNYTSTPTTTVSTSLGPKKVAVVLFNFPNDLRTSPSISDARATVFNNSAQSPKGNTGYYDEVSFGQLNLVGKNNNGGTNGAGDVYGWVTIPDSYTSACAYTTWINSARAIVGDEILAGYDYVIYASPSVTDCGGIGGVTTIGDHSAYIPMWITYVIGHEFGHMLGLSHAGAYDCWFNGCNFFEYADPFDIMGGATVGGHFHASRKLRLGILASSEVQDITTSGAYTLYPIERRNSITQTKLLRILKGSNYLNLEFRQPSIWDPWGSTEPIFNGVTLNEEGMFSNLIDTTLSTVTLADAPLGLGQTYSDSAAGISITLPSNGIAPDKSSATVNVTLTCARANPSFGINNSTQYGHAGDTKTYSITLTNNDTGVCGSSVFSVTPSAPVGWTVTPSVITATIVPHATYTTSFTVTSPITQSDGNTGISAVALNTVYPTYTTTTNASYIIDTLPPVVTMSAPANLFQLPATGTVRISSTAADPNRPNNIPTMQILIDGIVKKTCSTAMFISCTFDWTLGNVSAGLHEIVVTATDNAGNIGRTTRTVIYTSDAENVNNGEGIMIPIKKP